MAAEDNKKFLIASLVFQGVVALLIFIWWFMDYKQESRDGRFFDTSTERMIQYFFIVLTGLSMMLTGLAYADLNSELVIDV